MKNLKISFNAPATLFFVLICCAVTLFGTMLGEGFLTYYFMSYRGSITNPMTYVRLLTHVFGNKGWELCLNNMILLLLIGPILEDHHGSKAIIACIFSTALSVGLINLIFFPGITGGSRCIVIAFILFVSFTGFAGGEIPLSFIMIAVIIVGREVLLGFTMAEHMANLSQMIGGLIGALVGYQFSE